MYSHSHMGLMAGQQHPGNQWLPGGGGGGGAFPNWLDSGYWRSEGKN